MTLCKHRLDLILTDIDECEEGSNNCDENAVCTNVPGSYECACVGDYIGDGSAGSCTSKYKFQLMG